MEEKNERSEQTLKNLGREELIMRLKEMAKAEVLPMEKRPMGAMCYSVVMLDNTYTFVCPKCGRTVENLRTDPRNDFLSIAPLVKKMRKLGYDTKVEQLCWACCETVYPFDPYSVNILFYFRFKGEKTYHITIADEPEMYKAALAFLQGKNEYLGEYDELKYVSENQDIIEKMLGIKI